MLKETHFVAFVSDEMLFPLVAAPVIAGFSVLVYNTVAGNNQIDRVFAACRSHGTASVRVPAFSGQFLVAYGFAIGHLSQCRPYFLLKISAPKLVWDGETGKLSPKVGLDFLFGKFK